MKINLRITKQGMKRFFLIAFRLAVDTCESRRDFVKLRYAWANSLDSYSPWFLEYFHLAKYSHPFNPSEQTSLSQRRVLCAVSTDYNPKFQIRNIERIILQSALSILQIVQRTATDISEIMTIPLISFKSFVREGLIPRHTFRDKRFIRASF